MICDSIIYLHHCPNSITWAVFRVNISLLRIWQKHGYYNQIHGIQTWIHLQTAYMCVIVYKSLNFTGVIVSFDFLTKWGSCFYLLKAREMTIFSRERNNWKPFHLSTVHPSWQGIHIGWQVVYQCNEGRKGIGARTERSLWIWEIRMTDNVHMANELHLLFWHISYCWQG